MKLYGHRGARGLFPENTLQGIRKALEMGIAGVEVDVVVSGDQQLVLSHEPWMNPEICLLPNGNSIAADGRNFNLFAMPYAEIKAFDCGRKAHPRFPEQAHFPAYKPLLQEVLQLMTEFPEALLIIELKSCEAWYDHFQPQPEQYASLVMQALQQASSPILLQSFDPRLLNALHALGVDAPLGLIVENEHSPEANLSDLNVVPACYNPHHALVNEALLHTLEQHAIQLIPWTVNEAHTFASLQQQGIAAIITDFPDRFSENQHKAV